MLSWTQSDFLSSTRWLLVQILQQAGILASTDWGMFPASNITEKRFLSHSVQTAASSFPPFRIIWTHGAPWQTHPSNGDLRAPHHLPWEKWSPIWSTLPCRCHRMLEWNRCHWGRTACHLCRWKLPELWRPRRRGPSWLQLDHWSCSILYLVGFRKKRCLERSKATLCQLGCWILKPLYPLSCRSASPSIWKVSVNLAGNGPDWSKVPMMSTFLWLQRVSFSWPVYVQLGGRMLKGKPTNSLRELPLPVSRVGSGNPLGSLSFLACILAILLALLLPSLPCSAPSCPPWVSSLLSFLLSCLPSSQYIFALCQEAMIGRLEMQTMPLKLIDATMHLLPQPDVPCIRSKLHLSLCCAKQTFLCKG